MYGRDCWVGRAGRIPSAGSPRGCGRRVFFAAYCLIERHPPLCNEPHGSQLAEPDYEIAHVVRFGPLAESEEPAGCTAQNPVTVVPNGKSRMISIRISDDDYREIKSRCGERGPAIVSEFVRAAAMHALSLPEMFSFPAFLSLQVSALERRLDRLDEQVSTLADRMSIASQQQG